VSSSPHRPRVDAVSGCPLLRSALAHTRADRHSAETELRALAS